MTNFISRKALSAVDVWRSANPLILVLVAALVLVLVAFAAIWRVL